MISRCHAEYIRPGGRQPFDRIVQCDLFAGHDGDHMQADTGATWPPAGPGSEPLGWWAIQGEFLLDLLRRSHDGEDPDLLYAEAYANSDIEKRP